MSARAALLAALLLASAAALRAAPATVELDYELRAPSAPVQLGEWFTIEVEGPLPVDVDLAPPAADGEAAPDIVFGDPRSARRGAHRVLSLPVSIVRAGVHEIAGLRLAGDGRAEPLPPVRVEVVYERPAAFTPTVSGPAPRLALPMPAAETWPFLALALLGLAGLGAYTAFAGVRREVRRVEQPAHVLASEALARLRARIPDDPEAARAMVADVSAVLRRYIEARFALHAPARTTEEFLLEAAARRDALGAERERLRAFLTACDMATYAGVRPGKPELLELIDGAERFVEQTRDAGAPDAAAEGAAQEPPAPGDPPAGPPRAAAPAGAAP